MWEPRLHEYNGAKHDLTRLLQLYVQGKPCTIEFVPEKLANDQDPDEPCQFCSEEFHAEIGKPDYDSEYNECTCMDPEGWESYQYGLIERARLLSNIICNHNETWQEDIQGEQIQVECTFASSSEPINVRITCKERFCAFNENGDASRHTEKALNQLNKWGLYRLSFVALCEPSFTIVFEEIQEIRKNGYIMVNTELHKVLIKKPLSR